MRDHGAGGSLDEGGARAPVAGCLRGLEAPALAALAGADRDLSLADPSGRWPRDGADGDAPSHHRCRGSRAGAAGAAAANGGRIVSRRCFSTVSESRCAAVAGRRRRCRSSSAPAGSNRRARRSRSRSVRRCSIWVVPATRSASASASTRGSTGCRQLRSRARLRRLGRRDEARRALGAVEDVMRTGRRFRQRSGAARAGSGRYCVGGAGRLAAVAASPSAAHGHETLGLVLARLGRTDEAIAQLEVACRLDASSATARLNLGVLYAETGRQTRRERWRSRRSSFSPTTNGRGSFSPHCRGSQVGPANGERLKAKPTSHRHSALADHRWPASCSWLMAYIVGSWLWLQASAQKLNSAEIISRRGGAYWLAVPNNGFGFEVARCTATSRSRRFRSGTAARRRERV